MELNPVYLISLIIGLTEFAKRLGLSGVKTIAFSAGLGVVFGGGWYLGSVVEAPYGWVDFLGAAVVGIGVGLASSGVWQVGDVWFGKDKPTE